MRLSQLEDAASARLRDARTLLEARRWCGAVYLAGYAVEFMLKVRIGRRYRVDTLEQLRRHWPDTQVAALVGPKGHDLQWLIEQAGMLETVMYDPNFSLLHHNWRVDLRYRGNERVDSRQAEQVVLAATLLHGELKR